MLAHGGVGIESINDGVSQCAVQIRRVVKLPFAVVTGLLHQDLRLQQLALHVIDVHQAVFVAQLTLEQVVDLGNQLRQQYLLLILHRTAAGFGHRLQLVLTVRLVQCQIALPLVFEAMVRQHHLGQVHAFTLAPEVQ